MKGIQINNFFNNHISLTGKKNHNKPTSPFFQTTSPKAFGSHPNSNEEEPESMNFCDALTPQMKVFKKQSVLTNRKKRTNTIDPIITKPKQHRKSKEKKSKSLEKFKKILSLDKCNQKFPEEQLQITKNLNKSSKKLKGQKNIKQSYQIQQVRRSKSAIIKNHHSRGIQSKQISKQFTKKEKKNIISADSSFKDSTRKQLKKETQNLLKKKQQTDRTQCKTARVESTKIKSKKPRDKIISDLIKSTQKEDKKSFKSLTERKIPGIATSKSFLTSAKQSKPVSARDRKPSKKLFDSKQKEVKKNSHQENFNNFQEMIRFSGDEEDTEVKQALSELQNALQGISSKKALAKQLKKFTQKLSNIESNGNSLQNSQYSGEESNNQAFKKIKDFRNNLVKKKLYEAKIPQQINKDQEISKKKSGKKILSKKKELESAEKDANNSLQGIVAQNSGRLMQSQDSKQSSEPQASKCTQQNESQFINSKNVSEFFEKTFKLHHQSALNKLKIPQEDNCQILDERNKKYMDFLKIFEFQEQNKVAEKIKKQKFQQTHQGIEKQQNLILDINTFLNKQEKNFSKNYNSEKPHYFVEESNPILERHKFEEYSQEQEGLYEKSMSENKIDSSDNNESTQGDKLGQIEELRAFQQEADRMMSKIGAKKTEQKKRTLSIQLSSQTKGDKQELSSKLPSSPKYDDRYPHLLKSPKFSDIEITNILAAKEKCLASKHEKMNELVQKMYEKELVSPKSYEYYMYQLKKQFQDESQGLDGFKEQASEILNQINKQKDDIKAIDELIREEKWQQARKLMKGEHKAPSVFFGFKKNKDKVFEDFEGKEKHQIKKEQIDQIKPLKRQQLNIIQNGINITIKPQVKQIDEQDIQNELRKIKEAQKIEFNGLMSEQSTIKGKLIGHERSLESDSDSESYGLGEGLNPNSLTGSMDFAFDEKFRLKSSDDLNTIIATLPKDKFSGEFEEYMKSEKADTEEFEQYVYFQSQDVEENTHQKTEQSQASSQSSRRNKSLRQQGMFKLISVPEPLENQAQIFERIDSVQSNKQVIRIDQEDDNKNLESQEQVQTQPKAIQEAGLIASPQLSEEYFDESLSKSNSLIELELRKGFESNLFFIKEYCISLCEFIRDNQVAKNQFKTIISQPLQFDFHDLLRKYRFEVDGSYDGKYNSLLVSLQYKNQFRKSPFKAISPQLAKQFNATYGPLKFWNVDLAKKGRSKFTMEKETEAIFLSAILEVLNESLDFQRPGSIFGKPLPWANKSKHLKNIKYLNGQKTKRLSEASEESAETYDFIFGVAIARIIQWGSCLCGFLPDTAELQNTEIEDDYVVHIRQTRMAFLLQKMLAEEQVTFNNSELEQTQVMLYLGNAIYEELLQQVSKQISPLLNNSFNKN